MRLKSGGHIDRTTTIGFRFNRKVFTGHPGDTLASALMANGVRLMGRSFKYHRPRGVLTAGSEEPNALVELRTGDRQEPNTRATMIELHDGLQARSQNAWPSLRFDALAVNDRLSNLLTAGFYYKTFMWPASFWEKLYEPLIRRAAGLGAITARPDPDSYDKGYLHCDLLVIGAGPAGLMAALTAGRAGARVILADEDFRLGGRLNAERICIAHMAGSDWAAQAAAELVSLPNVRMLPRCTVFGAFDHGIYGAIERVADHLARPAKDQPRQILWRITSRRALLCAGAIERPIAFADNDRPGILTAGALRAYANRWAAAPAGRVAVFTNNDDGHRTVADLQAHGVEVAALIDARAKAPDLPGVELLKGAQVTGSRGRLGLREITVRLASGELRRIAVGGLGVSGGWNPNVALCCHQGARPEWREKIAAFVPGRALPPGLGVAGAAGGAFSTHAALETGALEARDALDALGLAARAPDLPQAEDAPIRITPFWHVAAKGRAWLDFQNDVTVKDIRLAHQEGFRAVEHLKRYTTLGMATDQGKTANMGGLAVMAELTGQSIAQTGTTMFRPPYTPVTLGALAGRARGALFRPARLTPSHHWATEQGAVFVEAGLWLRAQYFPRPGESQWRESVDREVLATRKSLGVCDVTTLGKIDVQGSDAAAFLNRIYCNAFSKLAVGRVRYGLMLREDGIAFDDGTAARMAEDHFVVTTTTANAVPVYRHMEFARQCLWPEMDVQLISTTEAWAQYAIAGPNARRLLQKLVDPDFDISNEGFPFMACAELTICGGCRARLFRISFSGELAYELAVPTRYGDALMRRIMAAGAEFNITPYGTEALGVMRIEKGHVAGNELNGQTTALNLGLGRMVSRNKDSIGAVLSRREGLNGPDALHLVGVRPKSPQTRIPAGAHLLERGAKPVAANDLGYLTSACYSPSLQSYIALGLLKNGQARIGEVLRAASPLTGQDVEVEITSPHFIDPEGARLRA